GPGRVRDTESGQRQQGRGGRVGLVEEDLREDQRGRAAVDEEVVVLQGAADPGGGCRLLRLPDGFGRVAGCDGMRHGLLLRGNSNVSGVSGGGEVPDPWGDGTAAPGATRLINPLDS